MNPMKCRRIAALAIRPAQGLCCAVAFSAACGSGSGPEALFVQNPVTPVADGPVRVLVYHDMEGLSGQDDTRTFAYTEPGPYADGRVLLTDDVNAVVAGLFEAGAEEVHVVDAHGSGNPEPDLLVDRLDPRAIRVLRDRPFRPYVDLVEDDRYEAVAVVGMHAKPGSKGFASHTYTIGVDWVVHGHSVTETEIIAYSWGTVGVPVIFASGDDRLAGDLETLPWIEMVVVKTATSASAAVTRPVPEARAELRAGARRALERWKSGATRSLTVAEPVEVALRAKPPSSLRRAEGLPGVHYADETVSFTAPTWFAAYDGLAALVGVATTAWQSLLWEELGRRGIAEEVERAFVRALDTRWLDNESGRGPPAPVAEAPSDDRPKEYFGVR